MVYSYKSCVLLPVDTGKLFGCGGHRRVVILQPCLEAINRRIDDRADPLLSTTVREALEVGLNRDLLTGHAQQALVFVKLPVLVGINLVDNPNAGAGAVVTNVAIDV